MLYKNVSDFKKKLQVGDKFKMVYRYESKERKNILLEQIREVSIKQSNSFSFRTLRTDGSTTNSWLRYPKAPDFQSTENGFIVLENGVKIIEYVKVI
jgi:hypothetical protein